MLLGTGWVRVGLSVESQLRGHSSAHLPAKTARCPLLRRLWEPHAAWGPAEPPPFDFTALRVPLSTSGALTAKTRRPQDSGRPVVGLFLENHIWPHNRCLLGQINAPRHSKAVPSVHDLPPTVRRKPKPKQTGCRSTQRGTPNPERPPFVLWGQVCAGAPTPSGWRIMSREDFDLRHRLFPFPPPPFEPYPHATVHIYALTLPQKFEAPRPFVESVVS